MEVGCLFDNDGVLVDSMNEHWMAWEILAKEMPEIVLEKEYFMSTYGKTTREALTGYYTELTKDDINNIVKRHEETYRKVLLSKGITNIKGIFSLLEDIKFKNMKRIIASSTSSENLDLILKTNKLGLYFDSYVSGDDVRFGKPNPEIFLKAAEKINIRPENCIVFEDSLAGIRAGRDAGCFVVAFETSLPAEKLTEAHCIFPTPGDASMDYIIEQMNMK